MNDTSPALRAVAQIQIKPVQTDQQFIRNTSQTPPHSGVPQQHLWDRFQTQGHVQINV